MLLTKIGIVCAVTTATLLAQQQPLPPARFDVVSIKPGSRAPTRD